MQKSLNLYVWICSNVTALLYMAINVIFSYATVRVWRKLPILWYMGEIGNVDDVWMNGYFEWGVWGNSFRIFIGIKQYKNILNLIK